MMDTVVVDSSVAIKWFVVEPYSVEAHYILEEYQAGTLTLLTPDLLYAEVGKYRAPCGRRVDTASWDQPMGEYNSMRGIWWPTP